MRDASAPKVTGAWPPAGSGPLAGLRVLDLSRLLPGPFTSNMLAAMGASVLKVEDMTGGDHARWIPPLEEDGDPTLRSARFRFLNGGRWSIQIDFRSEKGRVVLERLLAETDVLLESFRPGVLDRFGLGPEAALERHPRLVYASLTGFSRSGPHARAAGHDIGFVARSGLMSLTSDREGAPEISELPLADLGGGSYPGAIGILAALWERERSGRGQHVDVAIADSSVHWAVMQTAALAAGEQDLSDPQMDKVHYGVYRCADGWLTFAPIEAKFWKSFCEGVGRPDLLPLHAETRDSDTARALEALFLERTRAEWGAFSEEHDCCIEPVVTLSEAIDRIVAEGSSVVGRAADGTPRFGSPARFSRTSTGIPGEAPGLGAQTRIVMSALDFDDADTEELIAAGAVGEAGVMKEGVS